MNHRVFLTGATGFVGARVLRQLIDEGRDVAVLLRPTSVSRRIDDLLARCTVVRGDLLQAAALREALVRYAPGTVLHLAWDGVKGADRNSPIQLRNVGATLALYELAQSLGCKRFVGLGSQAEYGPSAGRLAESAPTRPTTAYGAAKLSCGIVLERTAAAADQHFAWLRLFSSYGPDDDPSWLIPYATQRLLAGERPSLTPGGQVWDYIHVDDVGAAVIATMDAGARGIFNLGSGHSRPLREIITMIRDRIDPALPLGFGDIPYRPDQVMHLEADVSALERAASWRARVALEEGLTQTIAWHQKERANVKP